MAEIFDQTLRDGLTAYPPLPTNTKLELVGKLREAGLAYFEAARFPADERFPQFHDNRAVLEGLANVRDSATVASFAVDLEGVKQALAYGDLFDELHTAVFVSPSYARYVHNETWEQSLHRVAETLALCEQRGIKLTVGVGTSFGCPLDSGVTGRETPRRVAEVAALGVSTIMLGDTAGQATPALARRVLEETRQRAPGTRLRVHFHNTFGRALANTWEAVASGIDGVDTSLLGLGGDRYKYFRVRDLVDNGNCATEEILALMIHSGLPVGLRLEVVNEAARWLYDQVDGMVFGRSSFAELVALKRSGDFEIQQRTGHH